MNPPLSVILNVSSESIETRLVAHDVIEGLPLPELSASQVFVTVARENLPRRSPFPDAKNVGQIDPGQGPDVGVNVIPRDDQLTELVPLTFSRAHFLFRDAFGT
jgi:hypothetical protein